jgi:hypothetical protein
MYIYPQVALGELEQTPKVIYPPTSPHSDHLGPWLCEGLPNRGARVIGLIVPFRRSFADFRQEVAQAVARHVPDLREARRLVEAKKDLLEFHHRQMLAEKVPDKTPLRLWTSFLYQGPAGRWVVDDIKWPSERVRWQVL